jgi:excinuclease ABC subunit A
VAEDALVVRGAREHNLKNVDVTIPRDKLTVITGLSGSGKSSLAFDTIYAEGQRRYVESLSAYARQFLGLMEKPDVDVIEGLSPAISIEQKNAGNNPRSTVGTVTEIYDYLRLLWARAGTPHCANCGRPVQRQSPAQISEAVLAWPEGTRIEVRAPLVQGRKGEFRELFEDVRKQGFVRAVVDGAVIELAEPPALNRRQNHDVSVSSTASSCGATTGAASPTRSRPRSSSRAASSRWSSTPRPARPRAATRPTRREARRARGAPVLGAVRLPACGTSLPELEPRQFSFNSPFGACPDCGGLGTRKEVSPQLVLGDPAISILEGVVLPWGEPDGYLRRTILPGLGKALGFDLNAPWGKIPERARHALLLRVGRRRGGRRGQEGRAQDGREGRRPGRARPRVGGDPRQRPAPLRRDVERHRARGARRVHGRDAVRVVRRAAAEARVAGRHRARPQRRRGGRPLDLRGARLLREVPVRADGRPGLDPGIAGPILKEVRERLSFLVDVGLDYLTLNRSAESLSGGEAQRIRLATQIGSRLVGVLYILDEPSIGLHQRDNGRLLATLKQLRDLGNTVIVVEHDEETMREADHLIDLGPGAGKHGGHVIAAGTVEEVMRTPRRSPPAT